MQNFVPIRARTVKNTLQALDDQTATGPDKLAARILKELASILAVPIAILARRMLNEAVWPTRWKTHYLVPIYKRDSVFQPGNYRGVHLTSCMSKVVERVIGNPLVTYLQQYGFGTNQWAFKKRCSARDLVFLCVSSWILSICSGYKIGIYLGDISGAFDRVFRDFMMAKFYLWASLICILIS